MAISITCPEELASLIDHTNLKPYSTKSDIKKLCTEAIKYKFGAVCVNPYYIKYCKELLKATDIKVCTVIGFPLGVTATAVKKFEANYCINAGADELDMVLNVGALKNGEYELVLADIQAVVETAEGAVVKVILETGYLTTDEKRKACQLVKKAGAQFVKTSTGFGELVANLPADVKLLRETVGTANFGVKAAGGIRNLKLALECIKAGANRLGTSASVAIMQELEEEQQQRQ